MHKLYRLMDLQVICHHQAIWGFQNYHFSDSFFNTNNLRYVSSNIQLYIFWMTFDLCKTIIFYNSKIKHRRCIKLIILILMRRRTIWCYFQRNRSMFKFLTHVELSRSTAAILEMPQYVAYLKMLLKLSLNSVQSLTVLTLCAQWMCLAALLIWVPEIMSVKINLNLSILDTQNRSRQIRVKHSLFRYVHCYKNTIRTFFSFLTVVFIFNL